MLAASSERPVPPRPEAKAISRTRERGAAVAGPLGSAASTGAAVASVPAPATTSSVAPSPSPSPVGSTSMAASAPPPSPTPSGSSDDGGIGLVFELDVPVGRVGQTQERKPLAVAHAPAVGSEGGGPARAHRDLEQLEPRLFGRARPFGEVAVDAAADHVLPGGAAPLRARDDVIQVQLGARQLFAAVLAGARIAHVDVVAREANLGLRDPIVKLQDDDPRDPDRAVDRAHDVIPAAELDRQIRPGVEVEGLELGIDDARDAQVQQRKRAP